MLVLSGLVVDLALLASLFCVGVCFKAGLYAVYDYPTPFCLSGCLEDNFEFGLESLSCLSLSSPEALMVLFLFGFLDWTRFCWGLGCFCLSVSGLISFVLEFYFS